VREARESSAGRTDGWDEGRHQIHDIFLFRIFVFVCVQIYEVVKWARETYRTECSVIIAV
jgi:hypothetical protein